MVQLVFFELYRCWRSAVGGSCSVAAEAVAEVVCWTLLFAVFTTQPRGQCKTQLRHHLSAL